MKFHFLSFYLVLNTKFCIYISFEAFVLFIIHVNAYEYVIVFGFKQIRFGMTKALNVP
jgi:hypothetical protein